MKMLVAKRERTAGKTAAGFTLVETLVAMALGSVMIAALYSSFGAGFSAIRAAREDLQATQILLNRVERIRLCTWSQVTNPAYNPPVSSEYFDSDNKRVPCTVTYKATVPPVGSLPEAYRNDMLLVTVEVTWTSGQVQHQRSLQTYVAKNGIEGYVSTGG